MDIALVTEGTYPYHPGGVSVWCDQLVRGLASHRFHVHAITGGAAEPLLWDLPGNLVEVRTTPLWGAASPAPPSLRKSRALHSTFEQLATSMIDADGGWAFLDALHQLYQLSRERPLAGALRSHQSLDVLLDVMRAAETPDRPVGVEPKPATLEEAVTALDLIEHQLRPLFAPAAEADLCHATANGLAVLTGMAARWARSTPFVMSEHGIYLRERYLSYTGGEYRHHVRNILLHFFRRLTWAGYQVADMILPGSEYNRRWEIENGAAPDRIRPIYNGVEPDQFPVAAVEPDVPTLSWVGRIDPLKDVETLLRAFAEVRASIPAARLRIFGPVPAGNEPYADRCGRLLADLDLDGAATFEGRVDSVVDAYHAGHVVVLTSISEGFPYTLLEAMAAGRATVATDVGGVREATGDAGIVVAPRDTGAIAAAAVRLLRDAELRRSLGEAARMRVLSRFTVEQSMDHFRDVYRQVTEPTMGTGEISPGGAALEAGNESLPPDATKGRLFDPSPLRGPGALLTLDG